MIGFEGDENPVDICILDRALLISGELFAVDVCSLSDSVVDPVILTPSDSLRVIFNIVTVKFSSVEDDVVFNSGTLFVILSSIFSEIDSEWVELCPFKLTVSVAGKAVVDGPSIGSVGKRKVTWGTVSSG